jgi:hypothetical protein
MITIFELAALLIILTSINKMFGFNSTKELLVAIRVAVSKEPKFKNGYKFFIGKKEYMIDYVAEYHSFIHRYYACYEITKNNAAASGFAQSLGISLSSSHDNIFKESEIPDVDSMTKALEGL